jgi:hypothetical protein
MSYLDVLIIIVFQNPKINPRHQTCRCSSGAIHSRRQQFGQPDCGFSRSDGCFRAATGKHGTEFGNLAVNPALLGLESFDGGGDDFGGELGCWHVALSQYSR